MKLKNRFVIQFINQWDAILQPKKFNWIGLTVGSFEFEYEKWLEGIWVEIVVLGLGVHIRYNLPASDKIYEELEKKHGE